jgi:hypothetical protein
MAPIIGLFGRVVVFSVVKTVATGALLGFGWVLGELVATRVVDRIEGDTPRKLGKANS